jgi:hypothetical protein
MDDLKDLMDIYLSQEAIGQRFKECVNQIVRPKHTKPGSSFSLDYLSLSSSRSQTESSMLDVTSPFPYPVVMDRPHHHENALCTYVIN